MKTIKYLFLMLLIALCSLNVTAQQRNILQVPDITTKIGKTQLPVSIENTDEIVGVQFDLTLPKGVTAEQVGIIANRGDGHSVTVSQLSSGAYRVMLHSPQNRPLRGQSGVVMYLPITIPVSFEGGSEHPLAISNAVLGKATGENVLTEAIAGSIRILKLPDLTVKNITCDEQMLSPGDRIACSWQVENIGDLPTNGGWSEQVSLVSEDGMLHKFIATTHYDSPLSAKSIISRQVEIALPHLLGIDGNVRLQVRIIPTADTGESASAQGNNMQTGSDIIHVNKVLALELSKTIIEEGSDNRLMVKLNRSGSWSLAESFNLSATTDSRLVIPSSVTIPVGQSGTIFYIELKDDEFLQDNDSTIVELSVKGNGYARATQCLTVIDNELPTLSISASKSDITEGETFQLSITTSRTSANPIIVTLSSETAKRFSFPSSVTIPAGETSVTVDVTAVEDDVPSSDLTNAFTVSASRFQTAQVLVILHDNDLPVLELTLTPNKVSESAGVVSVAGVLRRTTNKDSKITVKLSDDADGKLYFGNRTLELAKGVEEVHFNFGPVDNAEADDDRTYTISAAVWLSSCSCSASGESAGSVSAQLQVFDDDGPALNLTSSLSTVKEGDKTKLTITRNTATDNDLIVSLSSDYDTYLTYNHTITIPAGQKSVEVEVISSKNDISGDTHTVVFTVQAEGYNKGTCYIMVTDQTLPDARISSITADVAEAEVGTKAIFTIVVTNEGAAILPAEVPVKIFHRGDSNAAGTIYTSEAIPAGSSQTLTKALSLPQAVGTQKYYAVVNESKKVQELSYNNNTSVDETITTIAPFSITVSTDKTIYKQGEKVIITGQLSGNGIAETDIDIYLVNDGARQVQTVKTDVHGAFSYKWQLYALQSGHFAVGGCYPGEGSKEEMASFDVYGLKRTENSYITCDVIKGDTYEGEFNIINPSTLGLTGVKAEVLSSPENCNAMVSVPSTIDGGQTVKLSYQLQGTAPTDGSNWDEVKVRITTNEGVTLNVTLYFYCRSARAKIIASTNNIVTTMTKGKTREYNLQVTNIGRGSTGKITFALPDFIKSLSGNTLPALEQNSTIEIPLAFTPTEEMPLNLPVTGYLGINCESGDGATINYQITPVSEGTGTLLIDVCDENTYYTTEAPHLEGAQVVVRDYGTNAIISQGQTDKDGELEVILPSGYYNLSVTAENHDSYNSAIFVDPGVINKQTINLSIESIKVDWSVVETEVEDEYDIVTTVKYETNVPTPVVELSVPSRIYTEDLSDGESLIIYATLTNKGLITAFHTSVIFPSQVNDLILEPLVQNEELEISPRESVIIPFKITRRANTNTRRHKVAPKIECRMFPTTRSAWKCGSDWKWHEYKVPVQIEVCRNIIIEEKPDTTNTSLGSPVGDDWWSIIPIINVPDVPVISVNHCIPYLDHYGIVLLKCYIGIKYPILGCITGLYDCFTGWNHGGWRNKLNCVLTVVGCIPTSIKTGVYQCLVSLTEPYDPDAPPASSRKKSSYDEPSYITVLRQAAGVALKEVNGFTDVMIEYFGDSVWVTNTTIEEQFEILTELALNTNEYITIEELRKYKPEEITESQFAVFVERLNNSTRYEQTGEDRENRIHQEIIDEALNKIDEAEKEAIQMGYASVDEMFQTILNDSYKRITEKNEAVCATITLQFSQTTTLTRQGFRGTLTLFNGNEDTAMQNVRLTLLVINRVTGQVATSHEFQINPESLDGFSGELDLGSGWTLGANETGTATVLFIPTKYAAPTEPVEWNFGGTLSYIDPFTGLEVTRDLYPVTLTVNPSPELDLTYFMQRDVYGDDPLTEDVVEPKQSAEFALIINNKGYGDATNVRMLTEQPKIIDNEKGLFIDFNIKSSQVNGEAANLSFGKTIANNFGIIPAHSQAYAQWWLESSLLGHFTSYEVEATHITSYGNEDLSLLDTVKIHEMIHGFTLNVQHETLGCPLRGYLVNDIVDADDMPDMVYFTDAKQQDLYIAMRGEIERQGDTEYMLKVIPSQAGWNYGSVADPTHGRQKLTKIVRKSDGVEIPVDNIWQTDRTLRDGINWLYENRLHFVGNIPADGETFVLTFEPKPELELAVESYNGVPKDGTVLKEQLTTVTVKFNKPIKAETFTIEDITLYCQGIAQDASQIVIEKQNEQEYKLILNDASLSDGYYVLTVQTAGIEDNEGFNGSTSKQTSWIQYVDGKVALIVNVSPAEGGTVTPESGRFIYDSDVILKATPAEGYSFSKWMIDNETVSTDAEFTYHLYRNTELTALFKESVFTGLQPLEGDALHVTITPLPLRDNMFVSGNFKEIQHVSIYDMRGIKCLGLNNIQSGQGIYVSNLKTGIYYVQIVTDRGIYRTKVIKR